MKLTKLTDTDEPEWVQGNTSPSPAFKTWTKTLPDGRTVEVLQTGPRTYHGSNANGYGGSNGFRTLAGAQAAAKPNQF